jgi:hypothetical protein
MMHATKPSLPSGILKRNRGGLSFGCLLVVVLLAGLGFVGFKVGEVYWNYFEVKEKVREVLNWAVAGQVKSDQEILQKVVTHIREAGLELPAPARNIRIGHSESNLTISVKWKREVVFPGYTLPLNFEVDLSEIKRWGRGGLVVK